MNEYKTSMGWCPRSGGGQQLMISTVVNKLMHWQHAKINTPNKPPGQLENPCFGFLGFYEPRSFLKCLSTQN